MDQNEDLSSLHPVQQVIPVSKDLRLTSCLRVTHFYKTVLNLQRFEIPPEGWKPGTCLGSRAQHIMLSPGLQPRVMTASFQIEVRTYLTSIFDFIFPPTFSSHRLTWMQAWWKQKIKSDLFEAQRKGNSLFIENIRFLHRCEAYLYSVDSPNFCIGTNSKRPWHFDLIAPLIYILNA